MDLLNEIETSLPWKIECGIASGGKQFIEAVQKQALYKALCLRLTNPEARSVLLKRISDILDLDFDHQYENPYDDVLAMYLLALDDYPSDYVIAARKVLCYSHLFWAIIIARSIFGFSRTIGVTDNVYERIGFPTPTIT